MSKNITQAELISIGKVAFGMKKTGSDKKRKFPASDVAAQSDSVFSISKLNKIENDNKYFIEHYAKNKDFWLDVNKILIIEPIRIQLEKIERAKKPIKYDTILDVAKAKQFPISQLIQIRGNTAKCIWHNEKTGSLHYYPKTNTVHCFGACGESHDVIDVYMKLNNCTFREAVLKLQ